MGYSLGVYKGVHMAIMGSTYRVPVPSIRGLIPPLLPSVIDTVSETMGMGSSSIAHDYPLWVLTNCAHKVP
jgi:hypothetical protein